VACDPDLPTAIGGIRGHSPFLEDPRRFDRELLDLARGVSG
jgi:hypothetical protein